MEADRKLDHVQRTHASPPPSEAQLAEACLAGDETAWRVLVERHAPLVYAIARRSGLDEHEAEDVFQEVFVHLYRQLPLLRDPQSLPKWLITTTHRCAWRQAAGGELRFDCLAMDAPAPPPELVQQWERRHLVRLALDRLGGRCEIVLATMFRQQSEQSYDEIAMELGMARGSLGPTRARCLRKLARVLEEMGVHSR